MPSFEYMWRSALKSPVLGCVLTIVGVLMFGTCVRALREWAVHRPKDAPAILAAALAGALIAALGGYLLYRIRTGS